MSKRAPKLSYIVVNADQASLEPYPYLYVNADGSVRELHPNERKYLETRFGPFDGARPYTKGSYSQKDGWGQIKGFLKRSMLPQDIQISPAPLQDPVKLLTKQDQVQLLRDKGWVISEESDGTVTAKKPSG